MTIPIVQKSISLCELFPNITVTISIILGTLITPAALPPLPATLSSSSSSYYPIAVSLLPLCGQPTTPVSSAHLERHNST